MVDCDGNIVEDQIQSTLNPFVPPNKNKRMYYYEGSELMIQWTNQHGFGQNDEVHTNIVIQYACDDTLTGSCGEIPSDLKPNENIMTSFNRPGFKECIPRDGFPVNNNNNDRLNGQATETIPFNSQENNVDPQEDLDVQDDCRFPRHETLEYYKQCRFRKRNENLYIGDRNLRSREGAAATKQNNNGERHGYECPEEKDYYPYWHWTPWKDIANIVSDEQFCQLTREESGNVKLKGRCHGCRTCRELAEQPNNRTECEGNAQGGTWVEDPAHDIDPPQCIVAPRGQQNHLGAVQDGHMPHFNWTIPAPPDGADSARCILRIRYNISTADFNDESRFADKAFNGQNAKIRDDDGSEIGSYRRIQVNQDLAELDIEQALGARVAVNINSNQFPRTFQDRSYVFEIKKRPSTCALPNAKIHNVNVKGKRGNIVQAYPAHVNLLRMTKHCNTTE